MTLDRVVLAATLLAAVGSGLVAGLLFAFSTSVMRALGRLPAAEGMAAMQAINAAILNPVFGLVFAGTAVSSLVLALAAPFAGQPGAGWGMVGALLYLVGAAGITMAINVPLNDALARATPGSAEGERLWARYLARWTAWNHVRTAAALAAAALLTITLTW